MRELRLKYIINLVSNVGQAAQADARVLVETQKRIRDALVSTEYQATSLERVLLRMGNVGSASAQRQADYLTNLALKWTNVRRAAEGAAGVMHGAIGAGAVVAAGGYGASRAVLPSVKAFSDLESATQDLRIAMTDAKGQVSKNFDKISDEAVKLGNQLPGTTKDFMHAARSLVTQGVPSSVVANGGLRASSYVGALLDVDQTRAAEVIAKIREANGLKDTELVPMADLVQRAFFGFGIKPQDYLETAKYAAPTYNTMGITGLEKTRETLAIQGMAASVGLEQSSFGTNYAQMLSRFSQIDKRLGKKSKEAKEAKALLDEHGIEFDVYNDKGEFKGNRNMLEQLAKLRKLNPLEQTRIIHTLFGVEGGRPAQILTQKGLEGYEEALRTISDQADLDKRLSMRMETLGAKFEALSGTLTNVLAKIGMYAGNAAKGPIDAANDWLGGPISDALDRNPFMGLLGLSAAGTLGGAGLAKLGGLGAAKLGLGTLGAGGALVAGGLAATAGITGAGAAGMGIGSLLYGALSEGDREIEGRQITQLMALFDPEAAQRLAAMDKLAASDQAFSQWQSGRNTLLPRNTNFWDLTQPPSFGAAAGAGAGGAVVLGEGRLAVDVTINDDRVSVQTNMRQPLSMVRIDAGSTNPGSYGPRR